MYLNFYSLKEKPFSLTPDPKFFFLSEDHREALNHLLFGIKQEEGFILITGEVGTGKTTLCRTLLEKLDKDFVTALIFNPFLTEIELFRSILQDFGAVPQGETKKELMDQLDKFLLEKNNEGKKVVFLIDEAQNLDFPILEQIRMISNLETSKKKLLQIIFFAQVEFLEKLSSPQLKQLDQRISVRYNLTPLRKKDIKNYIYHRLAVAGGNGSINFSWRAINKINQYTKGIPRLINLLSERALINGFVKKTFNINQLIIRRAIRSIEGTEKRYGHTNYRRLIALTSILLASITFFIVSSLIGIPDILSQKFLDSEEEVNKRISVNKNISISKEPLSFASEGKKILYSNSDNLKRIKSEGNKFSIHIESFKSWDKSQQRVEELKRLGFNASSAEVNIPGKGKWFRIIVGEYDNYDKALQEVDSLKKKGVFKYYEVLKKE